MEGTNLEHGHYCYYVPTQDPNEHGGYVPSLVIENEAGHNPMLGQGDFATPWVWGDTREKAQTIADRQNADMGLSPERIAEIIASSMTKFAAR